VSNVDDINLPAVRGEADHLVTTAGIGATLSDAEFEARLEALARDIEHFERGAIFKIALRVAEAHELFLYRRNERGFRGWVEQRLGYSRSKGYDLVNLAKLMKVYNALDTFGTLPVKAIHLIAAPSTPETARGEIFERVKVGERLTCATVVEVIEKAKNTSTISRGTLAATEAPDTVAFDLTATNKPSVIPDDLSIPESLRRTPDTGTATQILNAAGASLASEPAIKATNELGKAGSDENDGPTSGERRKAENAALEIWEEMSHEARQIIREKVLVEFFATATGTHIYARIPTSTDTKPNEKYRTFLDALGVECMCKNMSEDFGQNLRARLPINPARWLVDNDPDFIARTVMEKANATKARAIVDALQKLMTRKGKAAGKQSNQVVKRKLTMPRIGVDEAGNPNFALEPRGTRSRSN
jgi:hypothetical protein